MALCHSLLAVGRQHHLTLRRNEETSGGKAGWSRLEAALGHVFEDKDLIQMALTHGSATRRKNYERLEFLGDRVLGLILAREYFDRCPDDNEGQLSLRLHALARQSALVEIAREIDLASFIKAQPGMDVSQNDSILSDVVESLIAALYLDVGMPAAESFVRKYWSFKIGPISNREKDAKSRLQEVAMEKGLNLPKYQLVERTGPDHAPQMSYEVQVDGVDPVRATAGNRKSAEQQAAALMLEKLYASTQHEKGKSEP